jgi:hypothetical protein
MAEELLRKRTATISRRSREEAEEVLGRWIRDRRDTVDVVRTEMTVIRAVRFDGGFCDLYTIKIIFTLKERSTT